MVALSPTNVVDAGQVLDALLKRGHSPEVIAAMEPRERLREYTGWRLGNRRWADHILDVWAVCQGDLS